ncbi:hypothetical protein MPLSOD_260002 [Mesorhizobium sp. SOD10]|nr:hypothetical protein MPLSOD_260002 [Mesorhizobium sp. SOD10]
MTEEAENNTDALIELTADVVSAYVSNNPVPVGELPGLIDQVHAALKGTIGGPVAKPEARPPAVAIKRSVTPDYIISLEDGKKFKSLKRHLSTHYGLTPEEYRASGACRQTTRWLRRIMPPLGLLWPRRWGSVESLVRPSRLHLQKGPAKTARTERCSGALT